MIDVGTLEGKDVDANELPDVLDVLHDRPELGTADSSKPTQELQEALDHKLCAC